MPTIPVDFEVWKAITVRRSTEAETENDVLRDLFGLPRLPSGQTTAAPNQGGWTWKTVHLPDGTQMRAEYKGKLYTAAIVGGRWQQDGQTYGSPSAAAFAITNSGINGWWFWSVKRPGDPTWVPLAKLRPTSDAVQSERS
jgi:hypothetical protein